MLFPDDAARSGSITYECDGAVVEVTIKYNVLMKSWRKWVIGIPGALLVGAFGSGLWETAIKPGGLWLSNAIIIAVSFGSSTLRDGIYEEAAKGLHEAAAQSLLLFLLGMLTSLPFVSLFTLVKMHRRAGPLLKGLPPVSEQPPTTSDIKQMKSLIKIGYIVCLVFFFTVGVQLIIEVRMMLATKAYVLFAQSLTVCKPYIADRDAELFQSRFAAVRTKAEYINIMQELRAIGFARHLKLPEGTL